MYRPGSNRGGIDPAYARLYGSGGSAVGGGVNRSLPPPPRVDEAPRPAAQPVAAPKGNGPLSLEDLIQRARVKPAAASAPAPTSNSAGSGGQLQRPPHDLSHDGTARGPNAPSRNLESSRASSGHQGHRNEHSREREHREQRGPSSHNDDHHRHRHRSRSGERDRNEDRDSDDGRRRHRDDDDRERSEDERGRREGGRRYRDYDEDDGHPSRGGHGHAHGGRALSPSAGHKRRRSAEPSRSPSRPSARQQTGDEEESSAPALSTKRSRQAIDVDDGAARASAPHFVGPSRPAQTAASAYPEAAAGGYPEPSPYPEPEEEGSSSSAYPDVAQDEAEGVTDTYPYPASSALASSTKQASVTSAYPVQEPLPSQGSKEIASSGPTPTASSSSSSSSSSAAGAGVGEPHVPLWHGCRNVDSVYLPLNKIDEGTYGIVFAARDKHTGEKVAVKRVKMPKGEGAENEGFPITALREINVLLSLSHPNIVRAKEMVVGNRIDKVYLVMEHLSYDVKFLMNTLPPTQPFTQAEVKCLMLQLLRGVAYMHSKWVIHRDLKTANLLMDGEAGRLAICDFGLARKYGYPLKNYTETVVTQWYRSPELLLGASRYGEEIDLWSVGCIFAELVIRKPLFPGATEAQQIEMIFKALGTPTEQRWPGFATSCPRAKDLRMRHRDPPASLRSVLGMGAPGYLGTPFISDSGLDLLNKLLTLDPKQRISAEAALEHPWFAESPPPCDPRLLPTLPDRVPDSTAAGASGR